MCRSRQQALSHPAPLSLCIHTKKTPEVRLSSETMLALLDSSHLARCSTRKKRLWARFERLHCFGLRTSALAAVSAARLWPRLRTPPGRVCCKIIQEPRSESRSSFRTSPARLLVRQEPRRLGSFCSQPLRRRHTKSRCHHPTADLLWESLYSLKRGSRTWSGRGHMARVRRRN